MEFMTVKKFANESADLYKLFSAYAQNPTKELEDAIGKCFAETVGAKAKVSVEDYDGDMMAYSNDPRVKAFADNLIAKMVDVALPDVINPSIGVVADMTNVDYGDVAKFTLENGALYSVAKAGIRQPQTEAQMLYDTEVTVAPENYEITLTFTLYDILCGRKNVAKEVMKATKSMEAEFANTIWSAVETAVNGLATPLKVTNYSATTATQLAERVSAWNNAKASFVGTPVALGNILPSQSGFQYTIDSDLVKLGHLQQFHGFDIIPTPQIADYTSANYGMKLDDQKLYVISGGADKIAKVAVGHSDVKTKDLADGQVITLTGRFGVAVATSAIAGVITL